MLGIVIPTIIIAEPTAGRYRDSDTIPDPTSLQPLDASVKTEQLRAYHARLDVINDAFLGTPIRQTGNRVERYICRDNGNGSNELVLRCNG
jgi:hypothetical protein